MMLYALGALRLFDSLYDIDTVSMSIYQPRRENVSTWTITVDELLDWAENTLKPKAELAFNGEGEFVPGSWCTFCKVAVKCRARAESKLELARYEFALPPLLTDEEIAKLPVEAHVHRESFRFILGEKASVKIPWVPPMMQAHGFPVGSLTKVVQYLTKIALGLGVEVYTGYAVTELVEENVVVVGARTGAKGVDLDGKPRVNGRSVDPGCYEMDPAGLMLLVR